MVRLLALVAIVGVACSDGTALQLDADVGPADAVASPDIAVPALDAAATVDLAADLASDVAVDAPVTDAGIADAPDAFDGSPDGSDPGGASVIFCVGSYSGGFLSELQSRTAGTGACAAPADVFQVCTTDVAGIASSCGLSCIGMDSRCIDLCIKGQVSQLGDRCIACYAAWRICTNTNCLAQCLADPNSQTCIQCQVDRGCRSAFGACTGLP